MFSFNGQPTGSRQATMAATSYTGNQRADGLTGAGDSSEDEEGWRVAERYCIDHRAAYDMEEIIDNVFVRATEFMHDSGLRMDEDHVGKYPYRNFPQIYRNFPQNTKTSRKTNKRSLKFLSLRRSDVAYAGRRTIISCKDARSDASIRVSVGLEPPPPEPAGGPPGTPGLKWSALILTQSVSVMLSRTLRPLQFSTPALGWA